MLTKLGFNREFSLLFILKMFETEFGETPLEVESPKKSLFSSQEVDPSTDLLLNRRISLGDSLRLPLFSLSRGRAALSLHAVFHLLAAFHLPAVCAHLDHVTPNWWLPFTFPIEAQDDFVTVVSTFPCFPRPPIRRLRRTSPPRQNPDCFPPPGFLPPFWSQNRGQCFSPRDSSIAASSRDRPVPRFSSSSLCFTAVLRRFCNCPTLPRFRPLFWRCPTRSPRKSSPRFSSKPRFSRMKRPVRRFSRFSVRFR